MPAPYTTTPMQQTLRDVADKALELTDGMRLEFTVEDYGTLAAAQNAVRAHSSAFASLRTKERRKAQAVIGDNARDTHVHGRYDKLACRTVPLPDNVGFALDLVPAHMIEDKLRAVDLSTGQRVEIYNANQGRLTVLVNKWFKASDEAKAQKRPLIMPWTDDEIAWLQSAAPYIIDEFNKTSGLHIGGHANVNPPADDIADMDLDEWAKGEDGAGTDNGGS